jgi:hypothetical protein
LGTRPAASIANLFGGQLVEDVVELFALLCGQAGAAGQAGFEQLGVGVGFLGRIDPAQRRPWKRLALLNFS